MTDIGVKEQHLICDREGKSYSVDVSREGIALDFFISEADREVAHASCIVEGNVLKLGDIVIADRIPMPEHILHRSLRRLFRRPAPLINYRGRGLGSQLLRLIIQRGTHFGFHEVHGDVVQNDLNRSPELLDWYSRYGFTVSRVEDPPWVASIRLRLGANVKSTGA